MNKYSIVIPCYNSSGTIIRCINSCINQTYKNIEVIVVDDGSIDNTYELCVKHFQNNDKIKLFKKENGGVSSARNIGLNEAEGNRIVFLDSDDELMVDALERYNKYNYDLVLGGLTEQNKVSHYNRVPDFLKINNIKDVLKYGFTKEMFSFLTIPVSKAFDLKIIRENCIQFDESLDYAEDTAFVIEYLACCKNIVFINYSVYLNHTDNLNSLSRRKIEDIWDILNKVTFKFEKAFKQFKNEDEYKTAYAYLWIRNVKLSLVNYVKFEDYQGFRDTLYKISKDVKIIVTDNKLYTIKDRLILFAIRNKYKKALLVLFKLICK